MRIPIYILVVIGLITGCNAGKDLGEITVSASPIKKRQYKTHVQFIQIAYIDLFNKTMDPHRLMSTRLTFDAQGDDDINYKLYVRQLIEEASSQLPSESVIKKDPEKFTDDTYLKFYSRHPDGYENKLMADYINKDKNITAAKIYYILMTGEEYRMF